MPETDPGLPGWGVGGTRRFLALASGRAVAQVLGMVWFFAAARILSDAEYGVLATGLAFFAICAGLGDLGTNRTIVRYVAEDPRTLWPAFRSAVVLRVAGGLAVGLLIAGVIALLPVPVSAGIVLLAGLIATASGVTELAYGALRSIGKVRTEMTLLVVERLLFVAIAVAAVLRGYGPVAVLVVYLFTNTLSAMISAVVVWISRPDTHHPAGSMVDAEARYTAAAFALVTVGPRITPVLVALLASATAVGVYSVAQRPIEAMTLFALSTAAPVLPIVRGHLTRDRRAHASHVAVSVAGAIAVALMPFLAWFEVSPTMVLTLFFGAGRYDGAEIVLRLLAVTALTWCFRGVGEFVLLGGERARQLLAITGIGTVITITLGIPLVRASGATGAAVALLVAELVMVVLLIITEPTLGDRVARGAYTPAAAVAVATVVALAFVRSSTAASVGVVVVAEVIALVLAIRLVRVLEVRP